MAYRLSGWAEVESKAWVVVHRGLAPCLSVATSDILGIPVRKFARFGLVPPVYWWQATMVAAKGWSLPTFERFR